MAKRKTAHKKKSTNKQGGFLPFLLGPLLGSMMGKGKMGGTILGGPFRLPSHYPLYRN